MVFMVFGSIMLIFENPQVRDIEFMFYLLNKWSTNSIIEEIIITIKCGENNNNNNNLSELLFSIFYGEF